MKNSLLTTSKIGRLTCTWVATGDPGTPLACVWTDAESPLAASKAEPFPTDEAGGLRLCA
jgi:hypothetical protein